MKASAINRAVSSSFMNARYLRYNNDWFLHVVSKLTTRTFLK